MFLDYYGLKEQPFGVTPDPRFVYSSAAQEEALCALIHGIEAGRGFMALIAGPGLGKTTILMRLMERLRQTDRTALLSGAYAKPLDLLRAILSDLGAGPVARNLVDAQRQMRDLLLREAARGKRVVVVVDEAQNLDDRVLETLRVLSNVETPQAKLLQIVLVGQPPLADKLAAPHLEQLRQRVSIIAHLLPLNANDIAGYIYYRLQVAGYSGSHLFTGPALRLLATHSGGIPRNINNLCFHALSVGCAKQQGRIDDVTVQEVIADLNLQFLGTAQSATAPKPAPPVGALEPEAKTEAARVVDGTEFEAENAASELELDLEGAASEPELGPEVIGPEPELKAVAALKPEIEWDRGPEAEVPVLDVIDLFGRGVPPPSSLPSPHRHRGVRFAALTGLVALLILLLLNPSLRSNLAGLYAELGQIHHRPPSPVGAPGPDAAANPPGTSGALGTGLPPEERPAPPGGVGPATAPSATSGTVSPAPVDAPGAPSTAQQNLAANNRAVNPSRVLPLPSSRPTAATTESADRGRLTVESNTSGAKITVDGQTEPGWTAPHVFFLREGTHVVSVSRPGSTTWTQRIHIDGGEKQWLLAKLEEQNNGIFIVDTDPPGMQVFIDGKSFGPSRVETILPPGWHECAVLPGRGLKTLVSRFELRPGQALTRKIRLSTPNPSTTPTRAAGARPAAGNP